jgi:hypothetical protein
MYYKYYDWISFSTLEYDGLIKNIAIMCSAYKVTTQPYNKKNGII